MYSQKENTISRVLNCCRRSPFTQVSTSMLPGPIRRRRCRVPASRLIEVLRHAELQRASRLSRRADAPVAKQVTPQTRSRASPPERPLPAVKDDCDLAFIVEPGRPARIRHTSAWGRGIALYFQKPQIPFPDAWWRPRGPSWRPDSGKSPIDAIPRDGRRNSRRRMRSGRHLGAARAAAPRRRLFTWSRRSPRADRARRRKMVDCCFGISKGTRAAFDEQRQVTRHHRRGQHLSGRRSSWRSFSNLVKASDRSTTWSPRSAPTRFSGPNTTIFMFSPPLRIARAPAIVRLAA